MNVDLISQGVAPFSPESAALRAGRMMLSKIQLFAERRVSFGDHTLWSKPHRSAPQKVTGYRIHLFFLGLTNVDLAILRVKERVARGGHDVPEGIIVHRFDRSTANFFRHLRSTGRCVDAVQQLH